MEQIIKLILDNPERSTKMSHFIKESLYNKLEQLETNLRKGDLSSKYSLKILNGLVQLLYFLDIESFLSFSLTFSEGSMLINLLKVMEIDINIKPILSKLIALSNNATPDNKDKLADENYNYYQITYLKISDEVKSYLHDFIGSWASLLIHVNNCSILGISPYLITESFDWKSKFKSIWLDCISSFILQLIPGYQVYSIQFIVCLISF